MIGQAAGEAFIFPQQQVARPTQAPMQETPEQGSPFAVEPPKDRLGYVEGLTSNYYNAYGRMRDYVENMWKDYGLDVTKPDFAQPGGGLLHQAYQGMEAELRMTANDLAEERAIQEEERKAYTEGKITRGAQYQPGQQLARTLQQEQRVTPTDLLPDVSQAIEGVSNKVYNTPGEAQRAFETLEPLRTKYEKLKVSDPRNAAFYQRQIDALRMPTYSAPDRTFGKPDQTAWGTEDNYAYATMARKIANDWQGNWENISRVEYDPETGESVSILIPESGLSFGKVTVAGEKNKVDKIVDKYIQNSKGQVYAVFTDPRIKRERLDNRTTDDATTTVFSNNKEYGGAKAITFLNKLRGPSGRFDLKDLYLPEEQSDYQSVLESGQKTRTAIAKKEIPLQTIKENIKKSLPSGLIETRFGGRGTIGVGKLTNISSLLQAYPSVAARMPDFQISKNIFGGKYTIPKEQYKQLTGKTDSKGYDALTENDVINVLSEYVSDILTEGITPLETITEAEFQKAVVEEGLTTEQDKASYRQFLKEKGIIIK